MGRAKTLLTLEREMWFLIFLFGFVLLAVKLRGGVCVAFVSLAGSLFKRYPSMLLSPSLPRPLLQRVSCVSNCGPEGPGRSLWLIVD